MKKITFKNPKGGTLYLAKVGFDWGGFWGMSLLYGLPFFLRKMNVLGMFCIVFQFVVTIALFIEAIKTTLNQEEFSSLTYIITFCIVTLPFSIYFGIRGGKLTARHYLEEGYECTTTDEALLTRARAKWDMDI